MDLDMWGTSNREVPLSERDFELFNPLRQLLASLSHLMRLRLHGTTPFGCVLHVELPHLKVRSTAVYHARVGPIRQCFVIC